MNEEKLIDRYEPLDSILQLYKRFGKSSNLVRHILRFIDGNIKVKQQDRRFLLNCMFKHQQNRNKKLKNFILSITADIDTENLIDLSEQLLIRTKSRINELEDQGTRRTCKNQLNNRIYRQIDILNAYRQNPEDFYPILEL